jgi:glycosyltransferase involved in cell wall biosynthesis
LTPSTDRPLSVLQVSGEYPPDPGGVGDYTRLLARALIARGNHCSVLTGRSVAAHAPPSLPGEPPIIPVARDWSWRSLDSVVAAIREHKPGIVHIQYQTGAYGMRPAINFLPVRLRRLNPRPRVVVTAHDLWMPYLLPKAGAIRRWVTRRLLEDADAVIVTNAEDQRRLAGEGTPDRDRYLARTGIAAEVIPIGSNIMPAPPDDFQRDHWRGAHGVREGEVVAVFFGLPTPSKGLRELVLAMARLPANLRLHIVGGEPQHPQERVYLAHVRATIAEHKLEHRIFWSGYVDPPAVSAHLLASDIGVLPFFDGASYRRGSLLAMLAHALPVITTRPPAPLIPPLVDGEHALLVTPGEESELVDAITRLASDAPLREQLARNGRALSEHFTWPAIAAAHVKLYTTLL